MYFFLDKSLKQCSNRTMRNKLLFLFLALLFLSPVFFSSFVITNAQYASKLQVPIIFPPRQRIPNFLGEEHHYTVTFRGNGEAVIAMKAIVYNTNQDPFTTVHIHFPSNSNPKDINIFQVIQQPQCIGYAPQPPATSLNFIRPICEQYQDPDYQYIYGNATYQKAPYEWRNNILTIHLPTPIDQNKYGSYFMYYRTFAYTHKNIFSAYEFTLQTPKFEDKINTLQIGITTDSDLTLKGAKGNVNYTTLKNMALPASSNSGANPRFDAFYNQIGQGTIIKNAYDLQPLESYTVKGMYADSMIKLYGNNIAAILFVLLLLVIGVGIIMKKALTKNAQRDQKGTFPKTAKRFFIATGVGFFAGLLICGYTVLVFILAAIFNNTFDFYQNTLFFFLFIAAISFAVYLFLLVTPAIIIGIKINFFWGIVTGVLTIVWLLIFSGITFTILFLFYPINTYPFPPPIVRPLNMGGVKSLNTSTSQ